MGDHESSAEMTELLRNQNNNNGGESPLLPEEACVLGSINVATCYTPETNKINYQKLAYLAKTATLFLDGIISASAFPLESIKTAVERTRKIGIGLMSTADLLSLLGVSYASETGRAICNNIYLHVHEIADETSRALSEKHGPYPGWVEGCPKRRNATLTSIAPTGTISMIAGCSSGIEPFFKLAYDKVVMGGQRLPEYNQIFLSYMQNKYSSDVADPILKYVAEHGELPDYSPQELKDRFQTSQTVHWSDHVKMQAVFQKHSDLAVSKTINLHPSAIVEDVRNAYLLAHSLGCKGLTVYRDGSREDQVIQGPQKTAEKEAHKSVDKSVNNCAETKQLVKKTGENSHNKCQEIPKTPGKIIIRERETETHGSTTKISIACGSLFITANSDEKGLCEVFTNLGKGGGCESQSEATARLVSIALRAGIEPSVIVGQLKGIKCPATLRKGVSGCLSCPDAIGRVLEKLTKKIPTKMFPEIQMTPTCPECHFTLEMQSGCRSCPNCGYSKCS